MPEQASDLARRLADQAETVCRHYLSNGRREGRYWLVGDTRNTPGRSLYVRLHDGGANGGAAGKWTVRDRRAWRPARSDRGQPPARHAP